MVARRTDPDVAVVAKYYGRSTRQAVKVSFTTFDQRTRNIDQNTLTQLHITLTYINDLDTDNIIISGLQVSSPAHRSVPRVDDQSGFGSLYTSHLWFNFFLTLVCYQIFLHYITSPLALSRSRWPGYATDKKCWLQSKKLFRTGGTVCCQKLRRHHWHSTLGQFSGWQNWNVSTYASVQHCSCHNFYYKTVRNINSVTELNWIIIKWKVSKAQLALPSHSSVMYGGRHSSPFQWSWVGSGLTPSTMVKRPNLLHNLLIDCWLPYTPLPSYIAWGKRHMCEQLA